MPEREIDGPTIESIKLSISLQNLLQEIIFKNLVVVWLINSTCTNNFKPYLNKELLHSVTSYETISPQLVTDRPA